MNLTRVYPHFFVNLLSFFTLLQDVSADTRVVGRIVDDQLHGLPYVNIGIPGKNIGTVSDSLGFFSILIPSSYQKDRILISSSGYMSRELSIEDLLDKFLSGPVTVQLEKRYEEMKAVVVVPGGVKERTFGNTTTSKFMSGGFSSANLGAEAAVLMRIGRKSIFPETVRFNVSYNKVDSARVRLNIYQVVNGEPGTNLLPGNVIMSIYGKKTGLMGFNISQYNLSLSGDILVSLELIAASGTVQESIFVSASIFGAPTYYRETSQGKWKKYKKLAVGIHLQGWQ